MGPDSLRSILAPSCNSCGHAGHASYLFGAYFLIKDYVTIRHAAVSREALRTVLAYRKLLESIPCLLTYMKQFKESNFIPAGLGN